MGTLIAACAAFLGTHFLLSHPLRKPLVDAVGERLFLGIYSLVAFATLGWVAHAYGRIPDAAPLWAVGDGIWGVASAIMLLASVLLIGSLIRNPALPDPTGTPKAVPAPRGVFAITRHPMMWGFGLWALAHILVFPQPAQILLAASIGFLALVGAAMQDRKKQRLQPDFWPRWQAVTSTGPSSRSHRDARRARRRGRERSRSSAEHCCGWAQPGRICRWPTCLRASGAG